MDKTKCFNIATHIWDIFGGEKIEAFILCWEDCETYLANIVEKPDKEKAPISKKYFPEIGYYGTASVQLDGNNASVDLSHVLPKNIPLKEWANFEELEEQLSEYGLHIEENNSDYKDIVLSREDMRFYCSAFEGNILINRIEFKK